MFSQDYDISSEGSSTDPLEAEVAVADADADGVKQHSPAEEVGLEAHHRLSKLMTEAAF